MATERELTPETRKLLELTPEKLVDIILKLTSDDKSLRAANENRKTRIKALKNKIRELEIELETGAQRISKYKELQASKDEVDKQNQILTKKVTKLNELNENIEQAVPILKEELDDANKQLQVKLRDNAVKAQALLDVRAAKKAEMDECSRNKEEIRSRMQSSVDDLNKRIKDYKEGETNKELIIDKLGITISHLKKNILGLEGMEQEQRRQLMEMHQRHDADTKKQQLIEKTLRGQCDQLKTTNALLEKRLETNQVALDKFTELAKPRSPSPKLLKEAKKPGDDKRLGPVKIARIGGSIGRKSPLNPNKLARKIKYRF